MYTEVKILIAEDEHITAMDFKRTLESAGYNVIAVVSKGEDILDEIQKEIPTLIISDINLKGQLDGIEAMSRVQEDNEIPFIYITAYRDFERIVEIYNLKPYEYLLKPIGPEELIRTVQRCLIEINKKAYQQ